MCDSESPRTDGKRAALKSKYLFITALCLLAVSLLSLDIWTKYAVYSSFKESLFSFEEYPVFRHFFGIDLSITYTANTGAAWGMLSSWQNTLLIIRMIAVIGLLAYILFYNHIIGRTLPLMLIAIGAIGNILDYFIYGHVVDMFLFTFWGHPFAVFNVADAAISIGVLLLCLNALKTNQTHAKHTPS